MQKIYAIGTQDIYNTYAENICNRNTRQIYNTYAGNICNRHTGQIYNTYTENICNRYTGQIYNMYAGKIHDRRKHKQSYYCFLLKKYVHNIVMFRFFMVFMKTFVVNNYRSE